MIFLKKYANFIGPVLLLILVIFFSGGFWPQTNPNFWAAWVLILIALLGLYKAMVSLKQKS